MPTHFSARAVSRSEVNRSPITNSVAVFFYKKKRLKKKQRFREFRETNNYYLPLPSISNPHLSFFGLLPSLSSVFVVLLSSSSLLRVFLQFSQVFKNDFFFSIDRTNKSIFVHWVLFIIGIAWCSRRRVTRHSRSTIADILRSRVLWK